MPQRHYGYFFKEALKWLRVEFPSHIQWDIETVQLTSCEA